MQSDPYIVVKVGKNEINDRDKYIPGDLNPIFGRMYELPAKLPLDHTLTITVMDWDRVTGKRIVCAYDGQTHTHHLFSCVSAA